MFVCVCVRLKEFIGNEHTRIRKQKVSNTSNEYITRERKKKFKHLTYLADFK
jgi:hypothetical protein